MSERQPTCTKCGSKPSVYFRFYSGERLCAGCFIDSIKKRVKRNISRYKMFKFNSRIAVGVSGGKDSVSLLHILNKIETNFPNSELIAVTIDEGIKGYRDEALKFARDACRNLDIEHRVLSFQELFNYTMDEIIEKPKKEKLKPCSFCGVLRRRALNKAACDVEADRLVTAHNLDDVAQTALLNIIRGDIKGLSALHPAGRNLNGFVRRVKPFCEVPERESTFYAYLKGMGFQSIPCPYSGEAMRNDIRNFLNRTEIKRPGTKFIIYRATLNIISKIDIHTEKTIGSCRLCGEPTPGNICRVCQMLGDLSGYP